MKNCIAADASVDAFIMKDYWNFYFTEMRLEQFFNTVGFWLLKINAIYERSFFYKTYIMTLINNDKEN